MANKMACVYFPNKHFVHENIYELHMRFCRKNKKVVTICCPFNSLHIVPQPELQRHLDECDDRVLVENFQNLLKTHSMSPNIGNISSDKEPLRFEGEVVKQGKGRQMIAKITNLDDLFVTINTQIQT